MCFMGDLIDPDVLSKLVKFQWPHRQIPSEIRDPIVIPTINFHFSSLRHYPYTVDMALPAEKLKALADHIADYRAGEIARPDAAHIEKWLCQFDGNVRQAVLDEMTHVLHANGDAVALGVLRA